jgi:ribosomal-protein-alanine N-acetyltransferase
MVIENITFRPLTREQAEEVVSWRYPPPYDLYNFPSERFSDAMEDMLRSDLHYYAVSDGEEEMIAFRCFGPDAQVAGGDYSMDALDMGGGLRPDLTGRALGRTILGAAIDFAIGVFHPKRLRATVASFNIRALRVCETVGYVVGSEFERPSDQRRFKVLTREAWRIGRK